MRGSQASLPQTRPRGGCCDETFAPAGAACNDARTMDRTDSARRLTDAEVDAAGVLAARVAANVAQAAEVRADVIAHLIVTVLAEGHALIEDLPGVGKTTLARALARSLDLEVARIQCTADLLPADVVGTNVFNQRESRFEFRPGPIFANVVLVDEINRASPKTQSGLLECMQERRVTVDVHTHELARPFLVLATQNPIEYEGTYPLPEAQVDRFMVRLSLGYPDAAGEAGMLAAHESGDRVAQLEPVAAAADVLAAQDAATRVRASEPLRALHRRAAAPHADGPARRARRQPARRPAAAARRQGARAARRPRPRDPRRRPADEPVRARAPHRARARRLRDDRRARRRRRGGRHPGSLTAMRRALGTGAARDRVRADRRARRRRAAVGAGARRSR